MTIIEEFKEHWQMLQGCCLQHPKDFQLDSIVEVIHWVPAPQDDYGGAICRLSDGTFLAMEEWQDYTGHG